ncbi:hypothetical protein E2562_036511 [Oryza meyeriana var. granulata]|uniref:Uncharacterized protein n=1 Tax=Oryza meyeriana var. granulata TaxID=110450 RepID=A0A6G1FG15_9ORYZ|nr:hypothetical protein E2562_036511 [Oryza meyeriana var. granulata]
MTLLEATHAACRILIVRHDELSSTIHQAASHGLTPRQPSRASLSRLASHAVAGPSRAPATRHHHVGLLPRARPGARHGGYIRGPGTEPLASWCFITMKCDGMS